MKCCCKEREASSLQAFRSARPTATWEQMRDDPHNCGKTAYAEIKASLLRSQRGLCAYCEMDLGVNSSQQRVEHYHSKSDLTDQKNWALDWSNLWLNEAATRQLGSGGVLGIKRVKEGLR